MGHSRSRIFFAPQITFFFRRDGTAAPSPTSIYQQPLGYQPSQSFSSHLILRWHVHITKGESVIDSWRQCSLSSASILLLLAAMLHALSPAGSQSYSLFSFFQQIYQHIELFLPRSQVLSTFKPLSHFPYLIPRITS